MGKMDRAGDTAPYLRLKTKIDEIKADPRYGFMFSGMLVADTLGDFIGRVFRLPGDGKPISIIDVSGVPSEITSRSEEHTSELQSLLRLSYAVFCLNKNKTTATTLYNRYLHQ